jgi:hypothetical protein
MATVTLKLTTPSGHPIDLTVSPEDDGATVKSLLERTNTLADYLASKGWGFADALPAGPSVRELAAGPLFAGYPCSPTTDDAGLPTWIMVNGKQAQRREKQGDVWYSYRDGEEYVQALRIPKGEQAPPVVGLPA